MAEQMYELLEMVEGVETTMENICTLATSIHVTKDIIVNLNITKLSLVECKNSLITFSNKEYNLDYFENKNSDRLNDTEDIKPIKIENVAHLEVKPEILNLKNIQENYNDEEIQLSPKRFEEMIGFDTEDLHNLNYEDGAAFEITERGTICKDPDSEDDESSNEMEDEGEKCRVCGCPASENKNYGGISCCSCKAFFRRGKPLLGCVANTDECKITKKTRVKCKSCRYNKCIQIGMIPEKVFNHEAVVEKRKKMKEKKQRLKERVEEYSSNPEPCRVCGAPAMIHLSYGARVCKACTAFFQNGFPESSCVYNTDGCEITKETRSNCKSCRYKKCIQIGMKPENMKIRKKENDEIKKPEGPSLQSRAETFVEFMKTVKKNDNLVLMDVLQALEAENYQLFSYVKEKNGVEMRHCSICTRSANIDLDSNHIKNHFNPHTCKTCGMEMLQFQSLWHNEQKHLKRCRFCCKYRRNMDKHNCRFSEITSGNKCETCGKTFKNSAFLKKHMYRHRPSAFYAICDICGRNDFKSKESYSIHVKKHTTLAYPCNLCPAVYKTPHELLKHRNNEHIDVLGQFCDLCGIVVPSLSKHNYFKHKPTKCEICEKEFGNKQLMKKHVKQVHEQSLRVQCGECNKEFSCRESLIKHNKNVHKIKLKKEPKIATMKEEEFF